MTTAKHIFFDLDHTLWDFEKNSREAISHLFFEYQFDIIFKTDFETFIGVYESINHHLWQLYALQQISKEELRYQRFHKTFLHFHLDDVAIAKRWADEYLAISPYKTHLIEGSLDILNYLKEKNYVLHIITNGFKEVQHVKLTQSKLKDFFQHIIISEDHGFNKPDIRIFELAQELSGATTAECVMIGDNYDNDVVGALNANWKAVYLSEKPLQHPHTNFYRIDKLQELKKLL